MSFRLPPKVPIAVRTGAIRTTERGDIIDEFSQSAAHASADTLRWQKSV
jgi:hypothetical protein